MNGVCVSCFDTNCQYCFFNASICMSCYSGYVLVNSTSCMGCTDYDSNCISCDPYRCTNCTVGYGIYLSNYTCIPCSTYCLTCDSTDAEYCLSCKTN